MNPADLRVAFAGTPEFAAAALRALQDAGFTVPLVLTQPDRPAGRGLKLAPSAVKRLALSLGLPLAQPRGLRMEGRFPDDAAAAREALERAAPDVIVVAAYGMLLPAWTLDLPRLGCLNIHASLLPRWRGAAPIQRAIEAGDAETGITIMQMDEGLDTGPMLSSSSVEIAPNDTAGTLHDKLAPLGAGLIVDTLNAAAQGRLHPVSQPAAGVTYAAKIDKAEAAIDWSRPAAEIERRVRAFDPFPGTHFEFEGQRVKLWKARAIGSHRDVAPGTVLKADEHAVEIACGDGVLELVQVQRPGGTPVPAVIWCRAAALREGGKLGSVR